MPILALLALALPAPIQSAPMPAAPQGPLVVRSFAPQSEATGWLGVALGDERGPGVAIAGITRLSPAARGGLRVGDRLLSVDGAVTEGAAQLLAALRNRPAGTEVELRVQRESTLALDPSLKTEDGRFQLGVGLEASGDDGRSLSLVISNVVPRGPAARGGLAAGDRLTAIEGAPLAGYAEFVERMKAVAEPRPLRVAVERTLRVRLGARPVETVEVAPAAPAPGATPEAGKRRARIVPPHPVAPALPPQAGPARADDLQAQLRQVSADLQALREELAALRAELRKLREQRGQTVR